MNLDPSRRFKRKMHSLKNAFALAPLCNFFPTGSLRPRFKTACVPNNAARKRLGTADVFRNKLSSISQPF